MVAWWRGHPPATHFFLAFNKLCAPPISRITAIAMLAECTSDPDRTLALRLLSFTHVLDLTDAVAQRAFDTLTATPLPTALTTSDALIAATAIEHSLPLYTLDPARFVNLAGLATIQPY